MKGDGEKYEKYENKGTCLQWVVSVIDKVEISIRDAREMTMKTRAMKRLTRGIISDLLCDRGMLSQEAQTPPLRKCRGSQNNF